MQKHKKHNLFPHLLHCCEPASPADALNCYQAGCKHLKTCIAAKTPQGSHVRAMAREVVAALPEMSDREAPWWRTPNNEAGDVAFACVFRSGQLAARMARLLAELPDGLKEPGDPVKPEWLLKIERQALKKPVPCEDF